MDKPKGFDNGINYDRYLAYLDSEKWRELRNECLSKDGFKCVICGSPYDLNAHHLIYPHILGTESVHDLITVCKTCHAKIEKFKDSGEILFKRWDSAKIRITIRFESKYDFDAIDFSGWCRYRKKQGLDVEVLAFWEVRSFDFAKEINKAFVGWSSLDKYKDLVAEFGEENVNWEIVKY